MIKNESKDFSCLTELYQTIESFKQNNTEDGFSNFNRFCKYAAKNEQMENAEGKIYRRIWKALDQPTHDSHPKLAHHDFGKVAFHGLEGRETTNEIKVKALESFFNHFVKKELKKICILFSTADTKEAFTSFEKLFKLSSELPPLKEIQERIYYKLWERMGKPTDIHLSEIAHPDFGKVAFHHLDNRFSSNEEKADALRACVLEIDCKKFSKNLFQQANNYLKRKSLEANPVNTSHLPITPRDEKAVMRELFNKYQGICIGDIHHDAWSHNWIYGHLDFFQQMGVTTLFLEGVSVEKQASVDFFNREGKWADDMKWYDEYDVNCSGFNSDFCGMGVFGGQFVLDAQSKGMKIIGIDSRSAEPKMEWEVYCEKDAGRLEDVNYIAAKIINQNKGKGKFVAWMGRGHLTNITTTGSVTFPSKPEIDEILNDKLRIDYHNGKSGIVQYSLESIASKTFNDPKYKMFLHTFSNKNDFLKNHGEDMKAFVEMINPKIHYDFKERIIPGVSELVQAPSIEMHSIKNGAHLDRLITKEQIETCLNGKITLSTGQGSSANFVFVEKLKEAAGLVKTTRQLSLVYN